jgi:hypothetical protein
MARFTGQILRFLGLLIELLGFYALAFRTGTDESGVPLPGSYPLRLVWGVIGSGFVIWLAGTIMNFWVRAGSAETPARGSEHDLRI